MQINETDNNNSTYGSNSYLTEHVKTQIEQTSNASYNHKRPSKKNLTFKSITMNDPRIKTEDIKWLWPGFIEKGNINIICGEGGSGKTTLLLAMAACLIQREKWPGSYNCNKIEEENDNFLYLGQDDKYSIHVVPVMEKLLNRDREKKGKVRFESLIDNTTKEHKRFALAQDTFEVIENLKKENRYKKDKIGLIGIDPITRLVSNNKLLNNPNEIQKTLEPLREFCQKTGITIVGLMHASKANLKRPVNEMFTGCTAWRDYSRSMLAVIESTQDQKSLVLKIKGNRGKIRHGFLMPFKSLNDDLGYTNIQDLTVVEGKNEWLRSKFCLFKKENNRYEPRQSCKNDIINILKNSDKLLQSKIISTLKEKEDHGHSESKIYRSINDLIKEKKIIKFKLESLDYIGLNEKSDAKVLTSQNHI